MADHEHLTRQDSTAPTGGRRWLRRGAWVVGIALAWTAAAGWLLPRWARQQVETVGSQTLGTPVALADLSLNPWTLTLTLDGLQVGPEAQRWLTLEQLQAQLSLQSLWRLTPVVRQLSLTRPVVHLERLDPERLNISPMLDRLKAPAGAPPTEPARFALYNIEVREGLIRYVDRVIDSRHEISALNIGVPFISNLPSQLDIWVQPSLQALVDGSPLDLGGQSRPFEAGQPTELTVKWQKVDIGHWLKVARPLMPPALHMQSDRGVLDTDLKIRFENHPAPGKPLLKVQGQLTVSDLALDWPARSLQTRLPRIHAEGLDIAPLEGQWSVAGIEIQASRIALTDRPQAPWPDITRLQMQARGLSSKPDAPAAPWQLVLEDAARSHIELKGQIQVGRQSVQAELDARDAELAPWLAALGARQPLPWRLTSGRLSALAQASVVWAGPQAMAELSQGRLQVDELKAVPSVKGLPDTLGWQQMRIEGVGAKVNLAGAAPVVDMAKVERVTLEKLDVRLDRDRQGRLPALESGNRQAAPADAGRRTATAPAPAVPWSVDELACRQCQVLMQDDAVQPQARWKLSRTDLTVRNLSSDMGRPIGIMLQAVAQDSGRLGFQGEVRPQPLKVAGKVDMRDVTVRTAQSYLNPLLNVTLENARAHAGGRVQIVARPGGVLDMAYRGHAGISQFRVVDPVNAADFLTWKDLRLTDMDIALTGDQIKADLGHIVLQDFYSRVIINANGRVNLADVRRAEGQQEAASLTTPMTSEQAAAAAAAPVPATAPAAEAPRPALRWRSIELRQGRVDFTDNFIRPNYSARLTQIKGDISGVASDSPEPADVNITGAVDDAAPLRITGRVNPLGPRLYSDIQGSAKGIELTRLTPYAGRYAGYTIDKGSLSVTVSYNIDNGQLKANNAIYLDQLTFGEKTDSPEATKLPVQLALALLKDRHGVIDINLPISGSLDDPQFSVGGIILKVLGNLLAKAITSPFALLGGGSEELGFVPFAPGTSELDDAAKQRLEQLAGKLQDRPSLKLEATGRVDPEVDVEGLRTAWLERLMRQAKAKATGTPLAEVRIDEAEAEKWLKAAYDAADIKKPRNVVGLARSLPPQEMKALLKASAAVGEEVLRDLANQRGDRVKAFLVTKLPAERVLLTASRVGRDGLPQDQGPSTRVQFAIK